MPETELLEWNMNMYMKLQQQARNNKQQQTTFEHMAQWQQQL